MFIDNNRFYVEEWKTGSFVHKVKNVVASEKSDFQNIDIIETSLGRVLFLDNRIQSAEIDEFIYHESLVHPALISHPNPKNVLVIGAGEGASTREILKHKSVENVFMIDVDEKAVNLFKKHLTNWHQSSFDDPRVKLTFMDGRKYLQNTKDKFDVIVLDLPEPNDEGPLQLLFTKRFYETVKNALTENGVAVLTVSHTDEEEVFYYSSVYNTLRQVFSFVRPYEASVPSFSSPWGFIVASDKQDTLKLSQDYIKERLENIKTKFYDEEVHKKLFIFPKYFREAIEKQKNVIEDNKLIKL